MNTFETSTDRDGSLNGMGAHCYRNRQCYSGCGGFWLLVLIILLSISWDTVEPTEYALLRNGFTGTVDMNTVYGAGRYFVGPSQRFIHFPSNLVTLSFGNRSRDDQQAIPARTGADSTDATSSGGQPVSLSISFQYQFNRRLIPQVYQTFGLRYKTFYLRFAQQALTNVAQQFTPAAFWTSRALVEAAFLRAVNTTLTTDGFAHCPELQLRSVGFQRIYEQTITNIQLQEQLRVTKSYQLEVTRVTKQVDILQAEADAQVIEINAEAARDQAVLAGAAAATSLQLEQQARSTMYSQLKAHLGWDAENFLQYVKMKALNSQPQNNVIVGVNAVGGVGSA